jgi:hypothetical protein
MRQSRDGQRRASDCRANAHVVKLTGLSRQTHFDIAQAFAVGQLRESHAEELIEAGEGSQTIVSGVAMDTLLEVVSRQVIEYLREDAATGMHGPLLDARECGGGGPNLSRN